MRSEGAISSTSASATSSERSSARSPCSIRQRCDVLIPASPATTRNDLRRASRIRRSRRPIVRASSVSIEHHFVHRWGPHRMPGAELR